ncbi:MAG: D-2-hydroxyacid dehydrogenase [Clostridiales bacterium]|nr:D-2-hydroxyacid dehydrogenase [Clostridiales bacterium]
MKIVILDGYTTNPGDLSWDWIYEFGDCDIYELTAVEDIVDRARDAEILITNKTPLRKDTLSQLKSLKYIGLLSTGYNIVDWEYAVSRGIPVCNIPSYSAAAVTQLTFALLFELTNSVYIHNLAVKSGEWSDCKHFCFWKTGLTELLDKNFGVVGFGKIGQMVAKVASSLGMNVLVNTPHPPKDGNFECEFVSLDELLNRSDVVSVHCPLTPKTEGLVNSDFLRKMKPSAFLINTSRGQVVDENALAEALENKTIAGAGVDVLSTEPPSHSNPLLSCDNCIITPHIAWAGFETRQRLMKICEENIRAFINGKPQNTVNNLNLQ